MKHYLLPLILSLAIVGPTHAKKACCPSHPETDHSGTSLHTDASLFNVESNWENNLGTTAKLSQIGGKPQIVAMVYTTCKFACPRILADIKEIQSKLTNTSPQNIGYCLITIDPKRDTIPVCNEYAQKHDLSPEQWTFLRGDPSDVLELANLIGVKYKQTPDGEFAHSNILTLINAHGEIVHQQIGLGTDPQETVEAIETLLAQN